MWVDMWMYVNERMHGGCIDVYIPGISGMRVGRYTDDFVGMWMDVWVCGGICGCMCGCVDACVRCVDAYIPDR